MRASWSSIFPALLLAAACAEEPPASGAGPQPAHDPGSLPAAQDAAVARAEFEAQGAARGSIEGLVLLEGDAPPRTPINTAAEGGCGLDPGEPALTEAWVVDRGRLANAFVWIENPPPVPEAAALEPVLLRQRGCVYRPHALGLRAGQTLRVTNEDRARHNVRAIARRETNPEVNVTQAEG